MSGRASVRTAGLDERVAWPYRLNGPSASAVALSHFLELQGNDVPGAWNCSSQTQRAHLRIWFHPRSIFIDLAMSATPFTASFEAFLLDEQPRAGDTAPPVVAKDRVRGARDRIIVGVVEDDVGPRARPVPGPVSSGAAP